MYDSRRSLEETATKDMITLDFMNYLDKSIIYLVKSDADF